MRREGEGRREGVQRREGGRGDGERDVTEEKKRARAEGRGWKEKKGGDGR